MIQPKDKNRLLMHRQEIGRNQKEIGYLIGADYRQVSVWELGDKNPSLGNGIKLGIVYRMPVDYLFGPYYAAMQHEIRAREETLPKSKLIITPQTYGELSTKEPPRNPWL